MVNLAFRTVIMYGLILLCVRVMGKRQISQLQTSELVVTLLISEFAVLPIQDVKMPLINGVVPMLIISAFEIVISLLMLKNGSLRGIICGRPVVVIENGRIIQENMKKLRMGTEELFEQLRLNGVFSLEEAAFAVIETNGMMSVMKNKVDDALTPREAGVKVKSAEPEVVVVSDGRLSQSSLALCGKTPQWAREQIKRSGHELSDVFLMTASRSGKILIIKKQSRPQK